jgi:hypothetical protein
LRAFITRWPIEPATQAIKRHREAWPYLNGVMKDISAPTTAADRHARAQLAS